MCESMAKSKLPSLNKTLTPNTINKKYPSRLIKKKIKGACYQSLLKASPMFTFTLPFSLTVQCRIPPPTATSKMPSPA